MNTAPMNFISTGIIPIGVTDLRQQQYDWVRRVIAAKGVTATEVERGAGLGASTLTRFLAKKDGKNNLSAKTISMIEIYAGVRAFEDPARAASSGFTESDALAYDPDAGDDGAIAIAIEAMVAGHNNIDPWVLTSDALELAGYLAGDVLIVDLNAEPKRGDVVCAQVYNWASGASETVFRIYEPPNLVAATMKRKMYRPVQVDNENTLIRGVVTTTLRPRRNFSA